jgi:hypothetical protein
LSAFPGAGIIPEHESWLIHTDRFLSPSFRLVRDGETGIMEDSGCKQRATARFRRGEEVFV